MGLDMNLTRKQYISVKERKNLKIQGAKGVKPEKVEYIIEVVGYWRKANAIHRWFVENVQNGVDNCQEAYVSQEDLKILLSLVTQVLEAPSLAHQLLPTQQGFFFGDQEYDTYYFESLKDTKKILKTALKREGDYYYDSSW